MSVDETPEKDPQLEPSEENSEVTTDNQNAEIVEETVTEEVADVVEEAAPAEETVVEATETTPEVEVTNEPVVEATSEVAEETVEAPASLESLEALASDTNEESVAEAPPVVVKEPEPKPKTKWYSLRVISGKERKIKERIDLEIDRSNWRGAVNQILVPTEKVYKIKNQKKVIQERNILPGYILVEADPEFFTSEMVSAISNIPNVIHFLGRNKPIPMRQSEANKLLGKVDESNEIGESMVEPFIVGETVKITDGAFVDFVGDIQEVNEEKKKLKVIVKIFGRGTEVELNFLQVEKQQ